MENNYKLIAMLLQPKGNYTQEKDPMGYAYYNAVDMAYDCGHLNIAKEILSMFAVNSDHFMTFDSDEDLYVDADADGYYLFQKVKSKQTNYKVKVYYEYAVEVNVEADTIEEACDKAYEIADKHTMNDLHYIGYKGGEVYDENGDIHEFE